MALGYTMERRSRGVITTSRRPGKKRDKKQGGHPGRDSKTEPSRQQMSKLMSLLAWRGLILVVVMRLGFLDVVKCSLCVLLDLEAGTFELKHIKHVDMKPRG